MNFNSHQIQLMSDITDALQENKPELVEKFKFILPSASKLYKTKAYDGWIQTIRDTPLEQLPITKYGHRNAIYWFSSITKPERKTIQRAISKTCESLFAYCNENEMCNLQSDYHFYFCCETGTIFKESDLGMVEGVEFCGKGKRRIAYVSELGIADSSEFY